jgi:hypothetical protein
VTGRRSNQLNYSPAIIDDLAIEEWAIDWAMSPRQINSPSRPSPNHQILVGGTGIEPVTAGV